MHITWLRPHQIVSTPQLYVDGTSRRDVIQGKNFAFVNLKKKLLPIFFLHKKHLFFNLGILGDCWLLSTCAAIAKKEELLHRVLPPNQLLYGLEYTGAIKF